MPNLPDPLNPATEDTWGGDLNAAIESLSRMGTHADRPTTGLVKGTLYACSTHQAIERWDGTTWTDYLVPAGAVVLPLDAPLDNALPAYSDEFDGTTLNPKWIPGVKPVQAVLNNGWLELAPTGFFKSTTISQAAPPGQFVIVVKHTSQANAYNLPNTDFRPGIYVGFESIPRVLVTGLALSGGPRAAMAIEIDSYSETADWGGFNGSWSDNRGPEFDGTPVWHKVVWTGTSLVCFFSTNGRKWRQLYTRNYSAAPTRIGYALYTNSGELNPAYDEASVDYFRVASANLPSSLTRTFSSVGYNGIIEAMRTYGFGTTIDAVDSNRVAVSRDTVYESYDARQAIDRNTGTFYHSQSVVDQFWQIDFGANRQLTVTTYGIAGRSNDGTQMPRNWELLGSNDGSTWTQLHNRVPGDGTNPAAGVWGTWNISGAGAYRYLRIHQTGLNAEGNNFLVLGEVEFWGTLTSV